jgi:hypothetical protein
MAVYRVKGPDGKIYKVRKKEVQDTPEYLNPLMGDPRSRTTIQDALGLGYGNEITAGLGAAKDYLTDDKPFGESYDTRLGRSEAEKASLMQENPELAMRGLIGGSLGSGGGAAKLLSPKGILGGIAGGMTLGAVEASGVADPEAPGARKEAAKTGAMFGAGGSLVGAVGETILPKIPSLAKGTRRLFKEDKPLSPDMARMEAEDILTSGMKREGVNLNQAVTEAETLGPNSIVADTLSDPGASMLGKVSRLSDESRQVSREGILPTRTQNAGTRLRADVGASPGAADISLMSKNQLTAIERNVGKDIDDFMVTQGSAPLSNQQALREFLDTRPEILKAARKNLNRSRANRDMQFEEGTNAPVIDNELEQYIRRELDQKITLTKDPLGKNTPNTAKAIDEKVRWDEMADSAASPELKDLRLKYGVAARNNRAYNDGVKFTNMSETDLKRWVDAPKRTPEELAAFKNGAVEDLSNKGNQAGKVLKEQDLKFRSVFGDAEADRVAKVIQREERFATTASAEAKGAKTGMDEDIVGDITGETKQFKLGGDLQGKRAYSEKGAGFMLVNAVIDSMNNIKVPREVQKELAKILNTSADLPSFLKRLEASTVTREVARVAADAAKKATKNQRIMMQGQAVGVLGSLMEDQ